MQSFSFLRTLATIKIVREKKSGKGNIISTRYLYFSLKNHLLLADKLIIKSNPLHNAALLIYEDYKKEKGLLLAFTRKNDYKYMQLNDSQKWENKYNAASRKQRKEMDETLSKARLLLNSQSNKDESYISKLKSVKINVPIPDNVFE